MNDGFHTVDIAHDRALRSCDSSSDSANADALKEVPSAVLPYMTDSIGRQVYRDTVLRCQPLMV